MKEAISIWADESTEIEIGEDEYNLVGYLITDSDNEEGQFQVRLRNARKDKKCWTTLHGSDLSDTGREIELLDRWLEEFRLFEKVYFHAFLYKKDGRYIERDKTYEHYFAKQSVFALANKMKPSGYPINTMFKDIATLRILFDRRRAHSADVLTKQADPIIQRLHDLEEIYVNEIGDQIKKISGKDYKTNQFTIRFSFVSSECFDFMQISDCLLYLLRNKIEQDVCGTENAFTRLFDKHFLNDLDEHTKALGYRTIYEYDKKLNFFQSNK